MSAGPSSAAAAVPPLEAADEVAARRRRVERRLALAALAAAAFGVRAQPAVFPQRPITLVVPFAPGGIADLTARAVGEAMGRSLGQPVVVDNRPSAGSVVATQAVLSARPDGHTLLLVSNAHALSATLVRKLPYDALRDLAPVATLGFFDLGLFVAAPSPLRSLADVLAAARAAPGRLSMGTITVGSTQHLAAELLKSVAGIELLLVPYRGSPAVLTALRSGEVDLAFEILGPMLPHVSAGAVRALAVSSARRNPALPATPTLQEAGLAGYDVASWNGIAAPRGTPPEAVAALNRAAAEAVASPSVRARLQPLGVRLQAGSPEQLQALLASETARWAEVIRRAGIQPE